jgi:hypothetical protein
MQFGEQAFMQLLMEQGAVFYIENNDAGTLSL